MLKNLFAVAMLVAAGAAVASQKPSEVVTQDDAATVVSQESTESETAKTDDKTEQKK